jgi:hypothetical protein
MSKQSSAAFLLESSDDESDDPNRSDLPSALFPKISRTSNGICSNSTFKQNVIF